MSIRARRMTDAGFTIIELLIATAVFAVILLVITSAILQFSKQYYKGVVASTTQGVARGLIDDITRSIQFSSSQVAAATPKGSSNAWCIGAKRYSFIIGKQVDDTATNPHGLVSDTLTACNGGTSALDLAALPATLPATLTDPHELLGQHMRLSKFTITGTDPYNVTIRVVYGDDDLLCSPKKNDCGSTAPSMNLGQDDLTCKSQAGSQFCAVSELSTTIVRRTQ